MLQQLERVTSICEENLRLKIDGKGCERICIAVESLLKANDFPESECEQTQQSKHSQIATPTGYAFVVLSDAKLNHYLQARNLNQNKYNMTV